jgi:hypothetical protein
MGVLSASSDNLRNAIGDSVARNLTSRYNNQAASCVGPSAPAFLCSGVTFRITETNPAFDPWTHSNFSRTTGAVSFAWVRSDVKFTKTVNWAGKNGFIFYPVLGTPAGKEKVEVVCYFPWDGATFYRSTPGGLGCGESVNTYPFPVASRPCRDQGITTAEQWLAHVRNPAGAARPQAYSCAFMVTDNLNAEAVRAFNEAIRVPVLDPFYFFLDHTEMRIKAWTDSGPTFNLERLPIEGFFYTTSNAASGLQNARIDQKKYYDKTGGVFAPIIRIDFPVDRNGQFVFQYFAAEQNVL